MIGQEPDQDVLVDPDVPVRPGVQAEAPIRRVGAEVPVRLLRDDQRSHRVDQLRSKAGVLRVIPGQGRGMQPLADVLSDPRMRPWSMPEPGQQRLEVDRGEVRLVRGDTPSKEAGQARRPAVREGGSFPQPSQVFPFATGRAG